MITRVTVEGFRGITATQVFVPETLTVLTGRNGLGKTTFFDAVDWCLFGEASRLGSQSGLIKNLYRSESHPSVEVTLTLGSNSVAVSRTEGRVTLNGAPVSERELAETLIVDPDVFPPYLRELGRQVRTVTYLPQEQMREFVTASLSSERRALLRGLLGVPNAGIVESSIKHVRDHFTAREKNLIEEADNLGRESGQLATGIEFDPTVDRDVRDFLAPFRERYGDRSGAIENLRSALEVDLAARENDAALLDSVLGAHGETATTLAQADREIAALEQQRAELVERGADADLKVSELTASIESALVAQQDAARGVLAEEARVANLSFILSKRQRFEELTKDLGRWTHEHDDMLARSAVLKKSAELLRMELVEAEKLADEYRLQMKLTQERAEIELRRAELDRRVRALQDDRRLKEGDLAAAKRTQDGTANEVAKASAAKEEASASHELALRAAQRAVQVTDLRNKLVSFVEIGGSQCPLCGAEYGTHDRLVEHLKKGASASDIDDQLRNARDTLSAAETKLEELAASTRLESVAAEEHRTALEQVDRDMARLKTQYDSLNLSLQNLGKPGELKVSADVLAKVDDLRAKVETANRSVSDLEDDLRVIESKRGRVASELENLKRDIAPSLPSDVTIDKLTEAREQLSRGRKSLEEQEQALRKLRDTHAALQSRLSDTRSQIAAAEGRLNAEHDRKRRVLADFDRQCESVGLAGVSARTVGDELQRRAKRLQTEIAAIRNDIGRARLIQRREIVNETVTRQRDLERRLAEAQEDLSVLRRAQNRFRLIAEELVARSKVEAESAGAEHLAAIQECVNDLYPHRHLNEVEIDFGEGELLVKDRWLTKGVSPHDYSSIGQANVLALSVFLGLALRQTFSLAGFVLLDEPVQNLDDLHFLAFLTLLKRVALSRQVIISTADSNVAEILRRQLRSWSIRDRRWCEYEWVAFQPKNGPTITRHEGQRMAVA